MADFGTIQPITLTEERKIELEQIMVRAYRALSMAACAIYQVDIQPVCLRKLRDTHLKLVGTPDDPLRHFPNAIAAVAALRSVEGEIIAGFVKTTHQLCTSFEYVNREVFHDVDLSDYYAEAEWAIWDAMYSFRGLQRFTTFVYCCVKNRLTNYVRRLSRREIMTPLNDIDVAAKPKDGGTIALMRHAVDLADLTDIERELIEAHLRGDRGYRSQLEREGRINPNTGRPYTKQWLSQIFLTACEKCRRVYEQKAA